MATGKVSDKTVKITYRHEKQVCLLPMQQLCGKAMDVEILSGFETTLLSVSKLPDEGYTTMVYP